MTQFGGIRDIQGPDPHELIKMQRLPQMITTQ
jgi:hypothetical protein